jgi:cysteine desulfurase
VRRGTEILPQITGGGQERKYRSGTENVPGIVGMAKALIKAEKIRTEEVARLRALQEYGLELMQKEYPQVEWNGPAIGSHRSPANLHFGFGELDGESLLIRLDLNGIAASLGSACSSGVLDPSHVLSAIGVPPEKARSGLRLTLGRHTTKEELTTAIPLIANVVRELQKEQEFS